MKRLLFVAASLSLLFASHADADADAEPCDGAPSGPPPLPTVTIELNYIELSHLIHAMGKAEHEWRTTYEANRDTPNEAWAATAYRQVYRYQKLTQRLQSSDQALRKLYYPC